MLVYFDLVIIQIYEEAFFDIMSFFCQIIKLILQLQIIHHGGQT